MSRCIRWHKSYCLADRRRRGNKRDATVAQCDAAGDETGAAGGDTDAAGDGADGVVDAVDDEAGRNLLF